MSSFVAMRGVMEYPLEKVPILIIPVEHHHDTVREAAIALYALDCGEEVSAESIPEMFDFLHGDVIIELLTQARFILDSAFASKP